MDKSVTDAISFMPTNSWKQTFANFTIASIFSSDKSIVQLITSLQQNRAAMTAVIGVVSVVLQKDPASTEYEACM